MDHLKPGQSGSEADTGKPAQFAGSMAEAIEDAFNKLLAADGKPTFQTDNNLAEARDRRRLFAAIAQGVVGYLAANQDSFKIRIVATNTIRTDENIVIQTQELLP